MNKKVVRVLALILVALLLLPFVYGICRTITTGGYQFIDAPFYFKDGNICDANSEEMYSIKKFSHPNGRMSPWSEPIIYSVNGVTYEFSLDNVEHPKVKFFMGENEYTIYDDTENILVKKATGWELFNKEYIVCPLPTANCFYTPISIEGLADYAVLVLETEENNVASTMTIWRQVGDNWRRADFLLPDGTSVNNIFGYARRHSNYNNRQDERIGDFEICMSDGSGYVVYNVFFSDNAISLIPINPFSEDELPDWKF